MGIADTRSLAGRADGRNVVRLRADAVGRGIDADVPTLCVRDIACNVGEKQARCDEITGALDVQLVAQPEPLRFALVLAHAKLVGVRLG